MTSSDTKRWKELFGKLLAMHGREWDDAQSRFYFDALKDCEFGDVQATGEDLMRTSKWFPKPAEWRQAIGVRRFNTRRDRERALAGRSLSQAIHCEYCSDTGMRVSDPSAAVERLMHCECRDTNPNYQIARARLRQADDTDKTPSIPASESQRVLETVRDFKRLSSGE